MNSFQPALLLAATVCLACGAAHGEEAPARQPAAWPGFRGPAGAATAPDTNTAVAWDVASNKGLLWKADLPLPGTGSAAVWGDRVFVSGAVEGEGAVFCFDAATGRLLWRGDVALAGAPESYDELTTFAAPTPATDGKHVFAAFANGTLAAFNLDGKPAWIVDLGVPEMPYGYASSPVVLGKLLLVQLDQENADQSALIAFDTATGSVAWRTPRAMGASWCSPLVIKTEKGEQIVLVSCGGMAAYDPKDGREQWRLRHESSDITPTPVFANGLVIASLGDVTLAVRPDGAGDVTETHVAWSTDEAYSDVPSLAAHGNRVFVPFYGTMMCLNTADGKPAGERDLDGQFYASPIIAGSKLYAINREGRAWILKADPSLDVLGEASFGEPVDATPAVADGCLFVRTHKRLLCIAPAGADTGTPPQGEPR